MTHSVQYMAEIHSGESQLSFSSNLKMTHLTAQSIFLTFFHVLH